MIHSYNCHLLVPDIVNSPTLNNPTDIQHTANRHRFKAMSTWSRFKVM